MRLVGGRTQLFCCYLNERGEGCGAPPTLRVFDANLPHDRYSDACARHAHLLIDDAWADPMTEPLRP